MSKIRVKEGMVIAVPATDKKGFVVGVVARVESSRSLGAAILVYFFGPRHQVVPQLSEIENIVPKSALSIVHTGMLRIAEGRWPILGMLPNFERAEWPIPIFGNVSISDPGLAWLTRFSDDRLGTGAPREETIVTPEVARQYPECTVWGVDIASHQATKMTESSDGT